MRLLQPKNEQFSEWWQNSTGAEKILFGIWGCIEVAVLLFTILSLLDWLGIIS